MKQVKLTITENYVSHWSWWQGLRELLQNAVDTGDYDVNFGGDWVEIVSNGGKVPIEALLLGHTTKENDDSTIGKFGEGMKLGFLVLMREGAEITVNNENDLWVPEMVFDETFGTNVLAVNIHENGVIPVMKDKVRITIGNVPVAAIEEMREKFLPLSGRKIVIDNEEGKAIEKLPGTQNTCTLFINGIFVTNIKATSKFKFDYDLKPERFVLDRDRDSASTFEVKYEAARLLGKCADILLLTELACQNYDDLENFNDQWSSRSRRGESYYDADEGREITMEEKAADLFIDKHGEDAWPISSEWDDKRKRLVSAAIIKKGYVPVDVNRTLYKMIGEAFNIEDEFEHILKFKPLEYLESFHKKYGRTLYSKARRNLEDTIEKLRVAEGK